MILMGPKRRWLTDEERAFAKTELQRLVDEHKYQQVVADMIGLSQPAVGRALHGNLGPHVYQCLEAYLRATGTHIPKRARNAAESATSLDQLLMGNGATQWPKPAIAAAKAAAEELPADPGIIFWVRFLDRLSAATDSVPHIYDDDPSESGISKLDSTSSKPPKPKKKGAA